MDLSPHGVGGHLTYCTNIHAAETWEDVARGLRAHLPRIKAEISPGAPMGVGLRLAAAAAEALAEPGPFAELRDLLGDDYYVFTVNGFPYGVFHGRRVKEEAYLPDWTAPERLAYTDRLADELAALLPEGMTGSLSTVPGTFKPWVADPGDRGAKIELIVEHLLRHAAHLVGLRERTGRTVVLALEPEPFCLLETIAETVAFFDAELFSEAAAARLARWTGLAPGESHDALRRHLGVCYDVCHAAVEFEDPAASVSALRAAGIGIAKLQLSSALRVRPVDDAALDALRPFDEPVYLHQTMARRNGEVVRYLDLDEALADAASASEEWRSHFHVPVFLEEMEHFSTTQGFLREILALHRASPISEHLEVETYTWDVLPEQYRKVDLASAIARELGWVRAELIGARGDATCAR